MPKLNDRESKRLEEIPGMVPSLREVMVGCSFAPRCLYADEKCRTESPELRESAGGHLVACWHSEQFGQSESQI